MDVIDTTKALEKVCAELAGEPFITVDTEFMRESTYWPDLCLIQMAGAEHEVIVDPCADGIKLAPFYALMADQGVLKVFHAARQDIEIIHHLSGTIPAPLFDTQIAAMVCGFGDSVSYSNLAKQLAGADIDKSSQYTDWSARPLSKKQLKYALSDVTHLRTVYGELKAHLEETGRTHWLNEEMEILKDPATYVTEPEDAWKRLKLRVKSQRALAILIALAAWREREAVARNQPRQRILKDDAIYDIAGQAPKDRKELGRLRSVSEALAKSARADGILKAVEIGKARDLATLPKPAGRDAQGQDAKALVDLLKVLLQAIAQDQKVAAKMIASADDLRAIAAGQTDGLAALSGWRGELFGQKALDLSAGRIALAARDGDVAVVPLTPDGAACDAPQPATSDA